jgi:hypothetical protein
VLCEDNLKDGTRMLNRRWLESGVAVVCGVLLRGRLREESCWFEPSELTKTCAEGLQDEVTSLSSWEFEGRSARLVVRGKPCKLTERTGLRCPLDRLMQTHKRSMAIETMICALRIVWKLRQMRDNFRSVSEPLWGQTLARAMPSLTKVRGA